MQLADDFEITPRGKGKIPRVRAKGTTGGCGASAPAAGSEACSVAKDDPRPAQIKPKRGGRPPRAPKIEFTARQLEDTFGTDADFNAAIESETPKGRFDDLISSLDLPDRKLLMQELARSMLGNRSSEQAHAMLSEIWRSFAALVRLQKQI
jgi:hypothetical protein